MLETIDWGASRPDKAAYKQEHDALMRRLVVLQQRAVSESAGLVVLFEGISPSTIAGGIRRPLS